MAQNSQKPLLLRPIGPTALKEAPRTVGDVERRVQEHQAAVERDSAQAAGQLQRLEAPGAPLAQAAHTSSTDDDEEKRGNLPAPEPAAVAQAPIARAAQARVISNDNRHILEKQLRGRAEGDTYQCCFERCCTNNCGCCTYRTCSIFSFYLLYQLAFWMTLMALICVIVVIMVQNCDDEATAGEHEVNNFDRTNPWAIITMGILSVHVVLLAIQSHFGPLLCLTSEKERCTLWCRLPHAESFKTFQSTTLALWFFWAVELLCWILLPFDHVLHDETKGADFRSGNRVCDLVAFSALSLSLLFCGIYNIFVMKENGRCSLGKCFSVPWGIAPFFHYFARVSPTHVSHDRLLTTAIDLHVVDCEQNIVEVRDWFVSFAKLSEIRDDNALRDELLLNCFQFERDSSNTSKRVLLSDMVTSISWLLESKDVPILVAFFPVLYDAEAHVAPVYMQLGDAPNERVDELVFLGTKTLGQVRAVLDGISERK